MKKPEEKSPAFQFYAKDYLSDTNVQLMSLEEEGCYIRLLSFCWVEGSIPNDETKLSRLCKGASTTVIKMVIGRFQPHPEDRSKLIHKRLDVERKKQEFWKKKSSEGGKKSAKKRWGYRDISNGGVTVVTADGGNGGVTLQSASASSDNPIVPLNSLMLRIGGWMGRRESTKWSEKEIKAFKKNVTESTEEDISLLEEYYSASPDQLGKGDFRRQDVGTLLNNWSGEIDRARKWKNGSIFNRNASAI